MKSKSTLLAFAFSAAVFLTWPALVVAGHLDCGQPFSNGPTPVASDCLELLRSAVGRNAPGCSEKPCICDVDGNGSTTATDALLCLRFVIGWDAQLDCKCGGDGLACTSAELTTLAGSQSDSGWTGVGHDADAVIGSKITVRTLRRCTDSQAPCVHNSECANSLCRATCDCVNDNLCEITGPTQQKHCVTTLTECATDTDCLEGVACVATVGPPLPLSWGGSPICMLTYFDGPISGTADAATGSGTISAGLRSRVFLGEAVERPCPRCGSPAQNPQVGQQYSCEGGQTPGAACTVQGVSADFGGVSHDCAPSLGANILQTDLATRLSEITTGTSTKTAKLPCKNFSFTSNPLNGSGKCLDTNAACTSNADCKRCTGDPTTTCSGDEQCNGKGTCAEAPDQPVSCGFWCQCGFCNDDPSLPCFETGDCPLGQTCQVGTGHGNAQNAPQQKPNDCTGDKFLCGMQDKEKCANTAQGRCSLEPFRACDDDATCASKNAGTCEFDSRPCFEPRISRTGVSSPLGSHCSDTQATCTNNADCDAGATCVGDTSAPQAVALFCMPQTQNSAVNSTVGITGPGAVSVRSLIHVCRCGDAKIGCDEQCDDGNTVTGDGCDDYCQLE